MSAPVSSHGLPGYLADNQIDQLLKPINPLRVSKDAKGMAHVEAYEIRAHLNRIFGFGRWDEEVVEQREVFESSQVMRKKDREGKPYGPEYDAWATCWFARVALTIRTPDGAVLCRYVEGATGDATNFPSRADAHDMAAKTAASQALKRCAINLGDQFGLSLYNKGSMRPLVARALVGMPQEITPAAADVTSHITAPLAPESETPEPPQRELSSPPAPASSPVAAAVAPAAEEQPPAAGDDPAPTLPPPPEANAPDESEAVPSDTAGSGDSTGSALDHVLGLLEAVTLQSPQEAMQSLTQIAQLAARHKLQTQKVPGLNVTVQALITTRLQQAAAATQRTKAEVAS